MYPSAKTWTSGSRVNTQEVVRSQVRAISAWKEDTRRKMSKRVRNAGTAPSREQLSREMRQSRLTLIIQQVEKEGDERWKHSRFVVTFPAKSPPTCSRTAQERLNELEAKMENVLATIDKVFKVELMKMPPSLQNARVGDLISGESERRESVLRCVRASDLSNMSVMKRRSCRPARCPSRWRWVGLSLPPPAGGLSPNTTKCRCRTSPCWWTTRSSGFPAKEVTSACVHAVHLSLI